MKIYAPIVTALLLISLAGCGPDAVYVVDEIIAAIDVYEYGNTMYNDPETGLIRTDDGGVDAYWREVKKSLTE
jgi:hypothetical protein